MEAEAHDHRRQRRHGPEPRLRRAGQADAHRVRRDPIRRRDRRVQRHPHRRHRLRLHPGPGPGHRQWRAGSEPERGQEPFQIHLQALDRLADHVPPDQLRQRRPRRDLQPAVLPPGHAAPDRPGWLHQEHLQGLRLSRLRTRADQAGERFRRRLRAEEPVSIRRERGHQAAEGQRLDRERRGRLDLHQPRHRSRPLWRRRGPGREGELQARVRVRHADRQAGDGSAEERLLQGGHRDQPVRGPLQHRDHRRVRWQHRRGHGQLGRRLDLRPRLLPDR